MRYLSESSGIVFSACILQLLVYPGKKLLVVYTSVFLRKFLKTNLGYRKCLSGKWAIKCFIFDK